jgi:hypothetical protein
VISMVIAIVLVQLVIRIVPLLLSGAIDLLEHDVPQALFGMIMTLLFALIALSRMDSRRRLGAR